MLNLHIYKIMYQRLSLSHPDIAFTLIHNDKMTYKTNGNGNLLKVIHQIYGLSVVDIC